MQLRILTIFEQQRIPILSFAAVRLGEEICIRIDADVVACDGRRVQALLYRNEDVLEIRAIGEGDSASVVAAFCVICEAPNQIRLLQALVAVGGAINYVSDAQVVFELEGSESELQAIEQRLQRHWTVERLAAPGNLRLNKDVEGKFPPASISEGDCGSSVCFGPEL